MLGVASVGNKCSVELGAGPAAVLSEEWPVPRTRSLSDVLQAGCCHPSSLQDPSGAALRMMLVFGKKHLSCLDISNQEENEPGTQMD